MKKVSLGVKIDLGV